MKNADVNILNKSVTVKCNKLGINARVLNNSKANTVAFCSSNPKRREFEIIFLENSYRISWRFLNYTSVMAGAKCKISEGKDPDQRRSIFSINCKSETEVNKALSTMLKGYSDKPSVKQI